MNRSAQRDEIASVLFGLTNEGVQFRNRWRVIAGAAAWFLLSGFTMALHIFSVKESMHAAIVVGLSFLKYIPLLMVVYSLSRSRAAEYLEDIYELDDNALASVFLEDVTFGYGHERITINDGKIHQLDENSSIILIGGPGLIHVNLDSAAVLEKVDGRPEVISPQSNPWKLDRFERIREIGKYDEAGKREYAIINLRDQFVSGLSLKSRTKDGIPIEAQGIKIIFSVLRQPQGEDDESEEYLVDEGAIMSLVYNQMIITPEPTTPSGITFPWDTTVIPLVITELEQLITSHTLSEILTSISQKEMDTAAKNNETIAQMRVEMTGQQTLKTARQESRAPNFESRSKITAQFFQDEFKEKAARLGVSVQWIDIGNWQLPSSLIQDKHKVARELLRKNVETRSAVEQSRKKHEMDEMLRMINNVIISNYEKNAGATNRLTSRELDDLEKIVKTNPELVTDPHLIRQIFQKTTQNNDATSVALEILKAFRKELITGKILIEKEIGTGVETQAELAMIDKALRDISYNTAHYLKNS